MSVHDDITTHETRFAAFIEPFCIACERSACFPLFLKREHSSKVLHNARCILAHTKMPQLRNPDIHRAALLAALYHDIGRFPQFLRWRTFKDAVSINHGHLASAILARGNMLDDEPANIQRLTRIGVCLHNRYALPKSLSEAERLVADVVRDADKLDILRIMAHNFSVAVPSQDLVLHVRNDPLHWSQHVVDCIMAGKTPNYSDLTTVNDFRLLLASWLRDLRFGAARTILARTGHVQTVLNGLPNDPALAPVLTFLHKEIDNALCEAGEHA